MFVHLHNHTHYSLLDGLTRPKEMVEIAKADGAPAIAMTDHGVLYGAIEFYKEAKNADIKPIIGCELYVAPQGRLKKEHGAPINHLTVVAYNNEGYENLMQLVTKAHLEGFYYKPRVDHGLLREYHKGLIALSGCLSSEVAETALSGDLEATVAKIRFYQELFGSENFFLEIMDHPEMIQQVMLRQTLTELSKRYGFPLVATNDNHYAKSEDQDVHDILLCIQTGKTIHDTNRMKLDGNYSIRSAKSMQESFADVPEAIANTIEIARRCDISIAFGRNLIPMFKTPENKSPAEYLRELCEQGFRERFGDNFPLGTKERLTYELEVIHNSGFDTYFLIVHDFVMYAKAKGVIVGPGRGSAAGSLVAYCLKITNVDPLKYDLLFERFLNPERVSMPDIDIDFDDERRGEVLEYVVAKYGRENVSQIITFGTMAARAAVRDVGRAMGYPYAEVDRIAKLVPPPVQGRHIPLLMSITDDPDLKKVYEEEPRAKALLDNAIRLEGTVRQAGTHACAVVISKDPLARYTPLQHSPGEEEGVISQFSMKPLEELGLLKMDFLGLRNLTIIKRTLDLIEERTGVLINIEEIPLDDKKTFELLTAGDTTGVFQMESGGMRRYLKELKPTEINDIIAMVSLYRPGPMPWIPVYIRGKHHPEKVKYLHKSFEPFLKETYGVAVYQEQILKLTRDFTGMSLGEVDILRKAVGKKDPVLLAEQREKFIEGAVSHKGHSKKFAEEVFDKVIEPFAAYGFNKSHAACYALIGYQTAYLKANYPTEFMAALLSTDAENTDRIVLEVQECVRQGIDVLPPSINESFASFTIVRPKRIRFGLKAIKGIGDAPITAIIESRKADGKFKSLEDFARRVPFSALNKKTLESLAVIGALDDLGERNQIAQNFDAVVSYAKQVQSAKADGQMDIFSLSGETDTASQCLNLKSVTPSTNFERLNWEKEYLGLFVSGHPLQGLRGYIKKKAFPINTLDKTYIGKTVKILGLVVRARKILTRGGVYMSMGAIDDLTGTMQVVVFPRVYQECGAQFEEGKIVLVEGKFDQRQEDLQIMASKIHQISLDSLLANAKKAGLFNAKERLYDENTAVFADSQEEYGQEPYVITIPNITSSAILEELKNLLLEHKGDTPVVVNIGGGRSLRRIKVPFGISLNEGLKKKISLALRNR